MRNTLLKFLKGQNRLARFSSLDDEVGMTLIRNAVTRLTDRTEEKK